jgi:oxygen-dependent protoporphyrinogen oxidase
MTDLPRSNETPRLQRIAVIGGGITGLTAAWELKRAGFAPVVFEAGARVGGAIAASREGEWLHELGPNSLLEGSADVANFIDALGLGARRMYADARAKKRYIVRGGQPVAMPLSPFAFPFTKLFSLRAKLALIGEPWRPRGPVDGSESVADFVVRRLGREFLDYAINPLVGGVYAGDPRLLSVKEAFPKLHAIEQEHGSLIRAALKKRNTSGGPKGRIFSFPDGLEEMPLTIARELGDAVQLKTTVLAVRRIEQRWMVETDRSGVAANEAFSGVVLAVPADALATLKFENVPGAEQLACLREIAHPPVASVFTGYRRSDVTHALDGFGVLVPEVERRQILGALFSSTLFSGRAPEGHVAITSFVGGMRNPELGRRDGPALLKIVQGELEHLLGVRAAPVFTHVRSWPRAIPQYTLGYERFKSAISAVEAAAPGLWIGGNCRDGISLANCIAGGRRLAAEVVQGSRRAVR